MLKITFTIILNLFFLQCIAQNAASDAIIGEWVNEENDAKIEIYKSGAVYHGKLIWGIDYLEADGKTSKKDVNNADEKLQSRFLINSNFFQDFKFEDGVWDGGTMYDPKSGKSYNCVMKIRDETLEIRSYVGIQLFGKTTYWKRSL
ncbi:DUF2147 domain-containing protein [Dyadobacter sediminis]|uniref:DUF2147 domain-containing protein n=1 Tax=Dyadobacter sediminis TaxID=1493691 RepID=A0A5R9KJ72_9BACT|nr:DUF2147 domain-containing protein [Dyadobacter sediminis]TLU96267.1 DUF2147 domain-containing protein [Dyadobacter sediminis]GGB80713.1 hypothetical protein GCM10011325_05320 [Dyadobacter sediminis]